MLNVRDDRGYNQGFRMSGAIRYRNERRFRYVLDHMGKDTKRVLEIGCGRGELSYFLAEKISGSVTGIDICSLFIEEARRQSLSNLDYQVIDFYTQSYGQYDCIVGNGILHHLDIDLFLQKIKNHLTKGGKMIFLEPNLLNPYCYLIFNTIPLFRNIARLEPQEKAFTKKFIIHKLEESGFQNIGVEYKDFLIPITPYSLVRPVCFLGEILEKTLFKFWAQSLYIVASL
jgi:2-polyprenyl-3-methyl-5-hydroxy-6-metoxy-1,4-benzoquinol methylase